jgi:AAA15 family ATPase/GTPase
MLIQFNFKNFKSFRDDTILDMTATKITELNNHVVSVGNEKLLPVAAIYGANASGKSNVLEAIRYMSTYVVKSFGYGDDAGKDNTPKFMTPTPFLMDAKSKNAESKFEVYFISSEEDKERTYNYGFTVNHNGVQEEWLNSRAKTSRGDSKKIFYRNGDSLEMPGLPKKSWDNIKISLGKETLVVSLGAKLKIEMLKTIRDWFYMNEYADFGQPVENFFLSEQLPYNFAKNKIVQNKVTKYFSSFDPSIIGFHVEPIMGDNDKAPKKLRIDALHKMIDSKETVAIPLKKESAGTLKMFALFPLLQATLENGSVLFVDELNARLHPLLVRSILIKFLNAETNPHHAQLIFTSHDTWQLNNNSLRRDEVWFSDKSDKGISTLYSLADFYDQYGAKIRKDENIQKNYLLGKYGAIPSMKALDVLEGKD